MDEEDLAELQQSQKLQTQGAFAGLGSAQDNGQQRGVLADIFRPSGDTMGVKLLQRMGWRQGQGVGPKVRRKARSEAEQDQIDSKTHLFAPEDSRTVSYTHLTLPTIYSV